MADIDRLSIQITADAEKANKALDGLIDRLRKLSTALNIKGFKGAFNGLDAGKVSAQFEKITENAGRMAESVKKASNVIRENAEAIKSIKIGAPSEEEFSGKSIAEIRDKVTELKSVLKDFNNGKIDVDDNSLRNLFARIAEGNAAVKNFAKEAVSANKEVTESIEEQSARLDDVIKKMHERQEAEKAQQTSGAIREPVAIDWQRIDEAAEAAKKGALQFDKLGQSIAEVKRMVDEAASSLANTRFMPTELRDGEKYTQTYKQLARDLTSAENNFTRIYDRMRMIADFDIVPKGGAAKIKELAANFDIAKEHVQALRAQMQSLQNNGRDVEYTAAAWKKLQETTREVTEKQLPADNVREYADEVSKHYGDLILKIQELKGTLKDMSVGKIVFDDSQFQKMKMELAASEKEFADYQKNIVGGNKKVEDSAKRVNDTNKKNINILANLVALGSEIEKIASAFDKIAEKGKSALQFMYKPVQLVVKEYKEKLTHIGDLFKKFADTVKGVFSKISSYWTRTVKGFAFSYIRKAITQVRTELSAATQSLASFADIIGTRFNDSLSQITSNFSYIARSIIGAFEPIINFAVPAINLLSDAIVSATSKIAEFIAALTGQSYYMVAKRQITDYAESVDKANKAQKNLISGIDDLNVISSPMTSTEAGMDDLAAQWEKIDVTDKMQEFADRIKGVAADIFEPIKKAWDNAGQHVIDGWKFMTGNIKKLIADIARDWLEVWKQPATQKILEDILHIIGYIEEGIGWIAKRFDEAWNKGERGKILLENIRDIIGIITESVKRMAKRFAEWAENLSFDNLMDSLVRVTESLKPLFKFIMGVIEDIWERIVLRHWKWEIETGIPHLLNTISDILDSFDFEKIRKDLQPVLDAFETMRENIETGIVDAIGNLGKRVAKFANSEDFTNFCNNVAWFMEQITAERVERLFEALGIAILDIAEALMKFVGSQSFKDFMQKIFDWYDSHSAEDIAGWIKGIAIAIGVFKFGAFAGQGVAKFVQFLSVFQSFSNLRKQAQNLKDVAKGIEAVGTSAEVAGAGGGFLTKLADGIGKVVKMAGGIGAILGGATLAVSGFVDMWQGGWNIIGEIIKDLGIAIVGIGAVLLGVVTGPVAAVVAAVVAAGTTIIILVKENWETVKGAFAGAFEWISEKVSGFVDGVIGFFKKLKHALIGDPIVLDLCDGIIGAFGEMIANVIKGIGQFVTDAIAFFAGLKDKAIEKFRELKEKAIEKFTDLKNKAIERFSEMKTKVLAKAQEIKNEAVAKFNALKDEALSKFGELRDRALGFLGNLKENAVSLFNNLKDTVVGIAGDIATGVSGKFWDMVDWAKEAFNSVLSGAWDIFSKIPGTISSALSGAKNAVLGAFSGAKTWLSTDGGNIVQGLINGITGMKDSVMGVFGDVADKWGHNNFRDKLIIRSPSRVFYEDGEYIVEGLVNGIESKQGDVESSMYGMADNAYYSFARHQGDYAAVGMERMEQFSNAVLSKMNAVTSAMSDMARGALAALKNGFVGLESIGENVMNGFMNGFSRKISAVWNAVRDFAYRVKDGFADVLQIRSPSKVFERFGEYIVEGLNNGISDNASSTAREVKNWFGNIQGIAVPQFDFASAVPKSPMRSDLYQHTDMSGTMSFDDSAIKEYIRESMAEVVGGLILPSLNRIEENSRITANKDFTIGTDAVGKAAQQYARNYQTRTGRPAYGY